MIAQPLAVYSVLMPETVVCQMFVNDVQVGLLRSLQSPLDVHEMLAALSWLAASAIQ